MQFFPKVAWIWKGIWTSTLFLNIDFSPYFFPKKKHCSYQKTPSTNVKIKNIQKEMSSENYVHLDELWQYTCTWFMVKNQD